MWSRFETSFVVHLVGVCKSEKIEIEEMVLKKKKSFPLYCLVKEVEKKMIKNLIHIKDEFMDRMVNNMKIDMNVKNI